MSSSHHNPHEPHDGQPAKNWLEAELRNVPLPDDLAARLKGIAAASDETIDASLRDIAVPAGLFAQLKSVPADVELDRRLRDVPVPASLASKLHAISALTDDELDSQLRDVEVPDTLAASLRGIAQHDLRTERQRRQWVSWVLAASLLVATTVAYLSAAGNLVMAMFSSSQLEDADPLLASTDQWAIESSLASTDAVDAELRSEVLFVPETLMAERGPVVAQVEVELENLQRFETSRSLTAEVRELFSPNTPGYANPLTDVFLAKHDFLATPVADTASSMKTIDAWLLRGVTPPLVPGVNWQSLIVDGKHPLVSPAAHAMLSTAQVPLSSSTLGYDLSWRDLLSDRMPAGSNVRTEDFLASQNYEFEVPRDKPLGLRAAAGPAPFAEPGFALLQIGVSAQSMSTGTHQPLQVTLAIDGSSSMLESGRLAQVERALLQWQSSLTTEDRVSVVVLDETADVLLENGSREDLSRVVGRLHEHVPQGVMNFAGSWRAAALLARETVESSHRQRMVLLTDGLKDVSPIMAEQLVSMAADLARESMPVDVVQLLPADATAEVQLADVARAGQGRFHAATSGEAIRSSLSEVTAGPLPVVAKGAKLQVTFRPEVVAEYRLVGHEPTGSGGLVGGPLEVNFQAGQVATALFEIKLKSTGDEVGTATLTWIDPETGEQRTLQQKISRLQFATSILESPVSLQRAAIAAQTAEVLRLSRSSAARTTGLRRTAQQAWQLPAHTRDDAAFQQLLQLVDLAVQVQTGRTARP